MVLLNTRKFCRTYGSVYKNIIKIQLIVQQNKQVTLRKLLFNLCKDCKLNRMSCIPPSTFTAGRIRETQRKKCDVKTSKTDTSKRREKYFGFTNIVLPLKYNSNYMNSIWGRYNWYSPHNVKKVNDAFVASGDLQQLPVNPSKNEPMIGLLSAKLDSVWAVINGSQSH